MKPVLSDKAKGTTRVPEPKPFPAWPDLRRKIASAQPAFAQGKESSREWCELVADMIVGRK